MRIKKYKEIIYVVGSSITREIFDNNCGEGYDLRSDATEALKRFNNKKAIRGPSKDHDDIRKNLEVKKLVLTKYSICSNGGRAIVKGFDSAVEAESYISDHSYGGFEYTLPTEDEIEELFATMDLLWTTPSTRYRGVI